jgi:hypothetical protein
MTTDATNVVKFERPQPKQAPAELEFVELRLNVSTCGLVMSVSDTDGNVFVLEYVTLSGKPETFDLARLATAWARWRQQSDIAS